MVNRAVLRSGWVAYPVLTAVNGGLERSRCARPDSPDRTARPGLDRPWIRPTGCSSLGLVVVLVGFLGSLHWWVSTTPFEWPTGDDSGAGSRRRRVDARDCLAPDPYRDRLRTRAGGERWRSVRCTSHLGFWLLLSASFPPFHDSGGAASPRRSAGRLRRGPFRTISGTAGTGQRLPPSPRRPWLPNLTRGNWRRCMAFGECAGTSPQQPSGDQDCQYDGGELGHVAGIGAIQ
jgi:hypothetical protein